MENHCLLISTAGSQLPYPGGFQCFIEFINYVATKQACLCVEPQRDDNNQIYPDAQVLLWLFRVSTAESKVGKTSRSWVDTRTFCVPPLPNS